MYVDKLILHSFPFLSSYSFHPIGEVKKKLDEILVFFFPQLVKKNRMKSSFFSIGEEKLDEI
jgi:hypothetical protein